MKTRCYNPNSPSYKRYGGRNVSICKEWLEDFDSFRIWAENNGYSSSLSIDRIDNNGPYSPDNCRWVNNKQQQNNKENNFYVCLDGITKTMSEWAELYNINLHTIYGRLRNGWDIEDAIKRPSKGKRTIMVTYNGKTQNIPAWAKEIGIPEHTLRSRIVDKEWEIERAITQQLEVHNRRS